MCYHLHAHAEADLNDDDDQKAADDDDEDGRGEGRKPDNARLAKRLRLELAALLGKPLKGTGNGHTTSKQSNGKSNSDANEQNTPAEENVGGVACASHSSQARTGGRTKPRKRPKTLAQCQANAMQKALHAKRMKKMVKKGKVQSSSTCMRPQAVSALQVLRSAGMST